MRTGTVSLLTIAIVVAFSRWLGMPWRLALLIAAALIALGIVLKWRSKRRTQRSGKTPKGYQQAEHPSWWRQRIWGLQRERKRVTQEVENNFELRRAFTGSTPLTREQYQGFTHAQNYYGHAPNYEEYRELWDMYEKEKPPAESYEHYRYERF